MKLIVLDCDGVISAGETHPFALSVFERMARINRLARSDRRIPAITLNTGRPSPYVEAVLQAIDGWQPCLYENGAGLYDPGNYCFETSPVFTEDIADELKRVTEELDRAVVQIGQAYWQPGKSVCLSLFARNPLTFEEIHEKTAAIVAQISENIVCQPAKRALNIFPKNINKGSGLTWLAERIAIDISDMAGVGDTSGDIDFLAMTGRSAAPGNAAREVKAAVQWVSEHPDSKGLNDILDYWELP